MNNSPILHMFQDLAKHCLGSGQAFSISSSFRNGISFSTPGSNSFPAHTRNWSPPFLKKKKTPSQHRRDRRRWEEHQLNKLTPAAGSTPATEESSTKETPVLPENVTSGPKPSPLLNEELDSQIVMEVDIPPPLIQEQVPVVQARSNDHEDESEEVSLDVTTEASPISELPQTISPFKQNSSKIDKKPKTEELHLSFCAVNRFTAAIFGRKFANPTFVGPHPRNKNHFISSTLIDATNLNQMKKMINEFGQTMNLIKIRVLSENKNYFPDQQNHCQECISCNSKE